MSNLYELLQKIKKNPSMYLGRKSILSFPPFWYGYTIAEDQFRIQADHQVMIQARRQERKFEDFLKWIREKYQVQTSQSWAKIILFYSEDERIAIDRFFERLSFKSSDKFLLFPKISRGNDPRYHSLLRRLPKIEERVITPL